MLKRLAAMAAASILWTQSQSYSSNANAFGIGNSINVNINNNVKHVKPIMATTTLAVSDNLNDANANTLRTVAFRDMKLDMSGVGQGQVQVPVAMWYPIEGTQTPTGMTVPSLPLYYDYKISIRRIGQLLAKWDFSPNFASRTFKVPPSTLSLFSSTIRKVVCDGQGLDFPTSGPVVLLAHGYLGSRFDLSHFAEALAMQGNLRDTGNGN